jgi:MFS family permease
VRAKGRQGASGPGLREEPELLGFLVVWVSGFLPFASVFLATFGLNWWIPRASGGALLGVTVGVANAVALLAAVLVAGAVDRASLLLKTCAAAAAGSLLLLPGFALGAEGLLAVAAAVLAYLSAEGVESLHRAGAETTLADLAPGVWAPNRTASCVGVQPQGARLLAPAVGGALLAAGTPWLLPVVAGAFALLAALPLLSPGLRRLLVGRSPRRRDTGAQGWWSAVRGSLEDARMAAGWMRERPVMLFLPAVGFACNLVVYPFYSLLPAFLLEAGLGDDAALYGRAAAAYGAGMLLCTLLFVAVPTRVRRPALVCTIVMLAVVAVL